MTQVTLSKVDSPQNNNNLVQLPAEKSPELQTIINIHQRSLTDFIEFMQQQKTVYMDRLNDYLQKVSDSVGRCHSYCNTSEPEIQKKLNILLLRLAIYNKRKEQFPEEIKAFISDISKFSLQEEEEIDQKISTLRDIIKRNSTVVEVMLANRELCSEYASKDNRESSFFNASCEIAKLFHTTIFKEKHPTDIYHRLEIYHELMDRGYTGGACSFATSLPVWPEFRDEENVQVLDRLLQQQLSLPDKQKVLDLIFKIENEETFQKVFVNFWKTQQTEDDFHQMLNELCVRAVIEEKYRARFQTVFDLLWTDAKLSSLERMRDILNASYSISRELKDKGNLELASMVVNGYKQSQPNFSRLIEDAREGEREHKKSPLGLVKQIQNNT